MPDGPGMSARGLCRVPLDELPNVKRDDCMSDNEVVEFTDVDIMFDDDIEFCRRVVLRVMLIPEVMQSLASINHSTIVQ
jgi:hypothetical protein